MEEPRATTVRDRLIPLRQSRRKQPRAKCNRANFSGRHPILIFLEKIPAILVHDLAKTSRILLFQNHERAIVSKSLRDPLISVSAPRNQVTPPLMGGLVSRNHLLQENAIRRKVQLSALFIA